MSKSEYLLRRLGLSVLVLIGVMVITFVVARLVPADPTAFLRDGMEINARIISIEPHRQRLGLSIRDVDNDIEMPEAAAYDDADDTDAEIEASQTVEDTVESQGEEPVIEDVSNAE